MIKELKNLPTLPNILLGTLFRILTRALPHVFPRLLVSAILLPTLVACGAAQDGSGESLALNDTTNPTLVQIEPNILVSEKGTPLVPASTKKITFTFSEPLDPSSIPSDNTLNFISTNGQVLKGTWAYDQTGQAPTLTFTFDLNSLGANTTTLPNDETYSLDFINTITDLAGNGLQFKVSFQTAQTYNVIVKTLGLNDKTIDLKVSYVINGINASSSYSITGNGSNTFNPVLNTSLVANTDFTLNIETQPDTDTFCTFSNTQGEIVDRDTNVELNCSNVVPYYTSTSADPALNLANWNSYTRPDTSQTFIHAGERRKFTLNANYSCDQLAPATDSLAAFNWACETVNGQSVIYSTGLKSGKYLSDLLDFANIKWLSNSVSVNSLASGSLIENTVPTIWWNNPVVVPSNNLLSSFETIYILTGDDNSDPSLNRAYTLGGRHAALVIDPKFILNASTANSAISVISTGTGSWIEGVVDAKNTKTGLLINGGFYTNVRNFEIYYAQTNGIELQTSEQVYLIDIIARNNNTNGLAITSAREPITGLDGSVELLLGNVVQNSTFSNNIINGIVVETTTINNRFSRITATNNGLNTGLDSSGISLSSNNFLSDSVLTSSAGNALTINGQNNIITMVTATADTTKGGGVFFTASIAGTPQAQNNFLSSVLASSIDHDTTADIFDSNIQVNSVNTANAESVMPNNYSPSTAAFIDFTQIGGNIISYLNIAVEPFNDNSGNDNGLCEANEKCLFTPNKGHIQGSGDLQTVDDTATVWSSLGIMLEEFTNN